jgi:tetraacyldisaccharide 4'-kinase
MDLYAAVARHRRRWFDTHPEARRRLRRPVISVGNVAVGGRGKTPLVARLATWLVGEGERPAVLSRGYARERAVDGVVVVRDRGGIRATLDESGDEPMLLARGLEGCAVVVSPDRYAAGRLAETHLGCTVHVLDDGFQHRGLHRDVDIVLVSADDLTNARVVPNGPLREPIDVVADADAIVLVDAPSDRAVAPPPWRKPDARLFNSRRLLGSPRPLGPDTTDIAPGRALALAGIAAPERFAVDLARAGWEVVDAAFFADHHVYRRADIVRVAARWNACGKPLVLTTEKDAVRLEAVGPLPFPAAAVPLDLIVEPLDEVTAWLRERIRKVLKGSEGF